MNKRNHIYNIARATHLLFIITFLAITQILSAQITDVRLNEILASNNTVLLDEDGEYSDWIEIYNSGTSTIDLTGWYLSDDSTNLKKWQFPSVTLSAGQFLIVFASDKNRTTPQLHTNFKLTSDGEFIALTQPDTTMITAEYRPAFPPQATDISFGTLGNSAAYFSTPTPGTANAIGTVELVISNDHIDEHSVNDAYVGTLITTDIDTSTSVTYSLLDDAGGRFKLVGDQILVANSTLLDFDTDTSHQIDVRTNYDGGNILNKTLIIYLNKIYPKHLQISEFMASNGNTLQDEDGDYSDWIEIHNTGTIDLNLENWYLTDDVSDLTKWQFPVRNLAGGEYLILFASNKDRTGTELHTNFKLSAEGEFLGLVQPNGDTLVSEYYPTFLPQVTNVSFGTFANSAAYFSTPTPGAMNSTGTVDLVLSNDHINEHSPNDTYVGTLITTDIDTNTEATYSLLDDAGGRFKVAGNKLQVADSTLLDFDTNISHQITVRSNYDIGNIIDRTFTIFLNKIYPKHLQISEFMASNGDILQDEDGDYSDWIEIHNTGTADLNLENWYITDDEGDLTKWQFPTRNLPAGEYLVIFASDKDRTGTELHTNFKLSAPGEYLGLIQPNGDTIVYEYAPQYPPQSTDISYGLYNGIEQFFDVPTPGSANTDGTLPIEPLVISPERGFYDTSFDVTISSTTPNAEIRYTLDGSKPTPSNGSIYNSPVSITTTGVLRAAAYKTGYRPSRVETHTYLFLNDVIEQPFNIPGYPVKNYSVGDGEDVPHDYAMDQTIVEDPVYSGSIISGLTDIPSMVIVVDPDSLFGNNFFYDAEDLEQRVSMELLDFHNPNQNSQIDCGIQGHSHVRLKRSLRLNFQSEYGSANWNTLLFENAPLNGNSAKKNQKRIVLRGGNNRSWARIWNPDKTTYTEDQWFRDSQIAMSGYGPHGNFVHLYINGIYWGLYNPVERPDHFFSAAYFGGQDEDWYAGNHDGDVSGDDTRADHLLNDLVNYDMTNSANYSEIQQYLDLDNFIDDIILHWYGAVTDWPGNNWWVGNRNIPPGLYRYYFWDGEWSWDIGKLGSVNGAWVHPDQRAGQSDDDPQSELWAALRENDDFMIRFADRIYLHCFNKGALTDSNSIARWDTLNQYIRDAIIAESAKWGDCMLSIGEPRRTRNEDWQDEVDAIANIMNGNVVRFLVALRNEGYYPDNNPPLFNQRGGAVQNGFSVQLSNPNSTGTVYYTTDGSDPRLSGGAISGNAQIYSSEIIITDTTTIMTRILDGGEWSALNQAFFIVDPNLSINLNAKVFLEGPYNSGIMSTTLLSSGYLPLDHPYNVTPWNYSGTENVTSIPADVVDWILVELRSSTESTSTVATRAAFLKSDGSVVDLDGTSPVKFDVSEGNYYIVIHHRNHLSVMSALAHSINFSSDLYDFTASSDTAYTSSSIALKDLGGGIYGMFSSDGNHSGIVTISDRNEAFLLRDSTGYLDEDYNLSGIVTISDVNDAFLNRDMSSQVP